MKTRRRSYPAMRPLLGALLIFPMVLSPLTRAAAEEQHQRSVSPVRQAPQPHFTTTAPVQSVPPACHQRYGQQFNPPGLNSTTSIRQYNPPGLQGSPNPNSPTMALPPGIGSTGSQTTSQGAPSSGGPPAPGAAGQGGYGAAYPVGYQGPAGIQPPSSYQAPPTYARQFTCRTVHYICVVPYTGACPCENDRREREAAATA